MTELDQLISIAFASEGRQEDVNKVYLALLRSVLFVPTEKTTDSVVEGEPFRPLFATVNDAFYLLAFDTLERLQSWAGAHAEEMDYVEISGRDMVAGLGDEVFVGLNVGSSFYKEFSDQEIKRLKMIVSRIDQMRSGQ